MFTSTAAEDCAKFKREVKERLHVRYLRMLLKKPVDTWEEARKALNEEADRLVVTLLNSFLQKAVDQSNKINMIKHLLVDFSAYGVEDLTLDFEPTVF